MKKIASDKPVKQKKEDKFQRYEFSKRIASRIISSKNEDSIVIGIYGKWGEGKTSVINFIEAELNSSEDIIPIRFNPWRFTDETALLTSFFNTLAFAIKENIKVEEDTSKKENKKWWNFKKEPLKTNTENIADVLSQYGSAVSFMGIGNAVEAIAKGLSNVNVETLKERFEELLISSNKKIVVFIDDIDRLDKQEIYSIFRLVKLTADFSNTYYILPFDDEMVASAIGERFAKGDQESGYNFLEKIIQVPLELPQAQVDALKQFCYDLVDSVIEESKIEFTTVEVQRFNSQFLSNILPRLNTPRLAVRYANSLSFSLALLKDEVNHIDLMLIEAVKIFYPEHYDFIKNNSRFFITSYIKDRDFDFDNVDEKKEDLEKSLKKLSKKFSRKEKKSIKNLLVELFPFLQEAFHNYNNRNLVNKWFKEKRIGSPGYFKRYFSYAVIKGEISDIVFNDFINNINIKSTEDVVTNMKGIIEGSSLHSFLYKLRTKDDDFDWDKSKILTRLIVKNGDFFPEKINTWSFGFDNPRSQVSIFIHDLLKKFPKEKDRLDHAKELISLSNPVDFIFDIYRWYDYGKTTEQKIFNESELREISILMKNRCLEETKDEPLFDKFSNDVHFLFETWKEEDPIEMETYVKNILENKPNKVKDLIVAFTSTIWSSARPEPYKSDFSESYYNSFKGLFDVKYIHEMLMNQFKSQILEEQVQFFDRDEGQTTINILRQFIHWYNNDIAKNTT